MARTVRVTREEVVRDKRLAATISGGFLAVAFVSQPETFPIFRAWVDSMGKDYGTTTDPKAFTRENFLDLAETMKQMQEVLMTLHALVKEGK